MKIKIKAKEKIKEISGIDFDKIKELSVYLIDKYDIKVEIKNFKVNYEKNT